MKEQRFEFSDILPVYNLFLVEDITGYFYFLRYMVDEDYEFVKLIDKYEDLSRKFLSTLKDADMPFYKKAFSLPLIIDEDRESAIRFFSMKFAINQYFTECNQFMYPFMDAVFETDEDIKKSLLNIIKFRGFYFNVSPIPASILKDYMGRYKGSVANAVDVIYEDYQEIKEEAEKLLNEQRAAIC